jgi:hypothetical protein
MLQLLHLDVLKNRSGVAHGMYVESGRRRGQRSGWCGRCPRWCGPTAGVLPREPNALGARSLPVRTASERKRPDQTSGRYKSDTRSIM